MTKSEIVSEISKQTGIEKSEILKIVEAFMESVKSSVGRGKNVYLRSFGSFIVKRRAEKTRNISKYFHYNCTQNPFLQTSKDLYK